MSTEICTSDELVRETWEMYRRDVIAVEVITDALELLQDRDIELTKRALLAAVRTILADAGRHAAASPITDGGAPLTTYADCVHIVDEIEHSNADGGYLNVAEVYYSDCLEITVNGHKSLDDCGSGWSIDSATLLLGYGGPNVRMTWTNGPAVTLDVAWGGDRETREIYAPNVASWIESLLYLAD